MSADTSQNYLAQYPCCSVGHLVPLPLLSSSSLVLLIDIGRRKWQCCACAGVVTVLERKSNCFCLASSDLKPNETETSEYVVDAY